MITAAVTDLPFFGPSLSSLINQSSSSSSTINPQKIPNYFSRKLLNPFSNFPQFPSNLTLRSSRTQPISSMAGNGSSSSSSTMAEERENGALYVPTPPNRPLRPPHSGYHFDGSRRQFFEGWYFKVSIPEKKQSFCFMYSVENPAFRKKLTPGEEAKYGRRFTGVGAQILGPDDEYICQYNEESENFWGSRHELVLGNTFKPSGSSQPPNKEVPPEEFNRKVSEGFQVTPLWNQGFICDDGRTDYAKTVKTARWEYSTQPTYGWGNVSSKQKATAGWLAAFPIFEPHWQICMASGLSTGWIEWDGERYEFENAPSYSEKNWGGAFPRKWFWAQCNVFEGASGEVALTAAGGLRELPGNIIEDAALLGNDLPSHEFRQAAYQFVGEAINGDCSFGHHCAILIGVHYGGVFYEFVPWNGQLEWDIAPWGYWKMSADNGSYLVELEATTEDPGCTLRAPTKEAGLAPACKDACRGKLKLQIWERKSDGTKGKTILDVKSEMAAVEIGGGPWFNTWKGKTVTPVILSSALRVPIDVESVFSWVPFLKPPGL